MQGRIEHCLWRSLSALSQPRYPPST
jgi:hypothetical protein